MPGAVTPSPYRVFMGGEHTFGNIDRAAAALEAMVTGLDVALLPGAAAAQLATRLVTVERVVAACRSRAVRRAAEANQWRQAGERSPAAWVAKVTGTTTGQAAAELETAALLEALPATATARSSGTISELQAREIAGAATADPGAEAALLRRAAIDDANAFRRRCAAVRAAAVTDEAAARERLRRERRFRSWTDPEGGFCFAGRGLPEDGAALLTAIRPRQDAAFAAARRRGTHESTDAYAYDGLIALSRHPTDNSSSAAPAASEQRTGCGGLATGAPKVPTGAPGVAESLFDPAAPPQATTHQQLESDAGVNAGRHGPRGQATGPLGVKLIVRIDHTALLRGHTIPGEVCEIAGIGPIPVTTARELARDAFLTAVVTDGIDIQRVVHLGRAATAHQRTALQARGMTCAVPGCGTTTRLEIDHVDGWAITRRTHIDQLDWLCHFHHGQKTTYSYRLDGPPGNRTWHPPGQPLPPGSAPSGAAAGSPTIPP